MKKGETIRMLFAEEEIKELFTRSRPLYDAQQEDSPDDGFTIFRDRLLRVTASFGAEGEGEDLFGKQQMYNPTQLPFLCFFHALNQK